MSQGEDAYLVLRGVFHVSPPALGGLSIDGKLTFSNDAYLKLTTEWNLLHRELTNPNDSENENRTFNDQRKCGSSRIEPLCERMAALPHCSQSRTLRR